MLGNSRTHRSLLFATRHHIPAGSLLRMLPVSPPPPRQLIPPNYRSVDGCMAAPGAARRCCAPGGRRGPGGGALAAGRLLVRCRARCRSGEQPSQFDARGESQRLQSAGETIILESGVNSSLEVAGGWECRGGLVFKAHRLCLSLRVIKKKKRECRHGGRVGIN